MTTPVPAVASQTVLPPLNTPIAHDGSPECPVALETSIIATSDLWEGQPKSFPIAGLARWEFIATYTIIARAPADRIAELEAAITAYRDVYDIADCLPADRGGHNGPKGQALMRAQNARLALFATLKGTTDA